MVHRLTVHSYANRVVGLLAKSMACQGVPGPLRFHVQMCACVLCVVLLCFFLFFSFLTVPLGLVVLGGNQTESRSHVGGSPNSRQTQMSLAMSDSLLGNRKAGAKASGFEAEAQSRGPQSGDPHSKGLCELLIARVIDQGATTGKLGLCPEVSRNQDWRTIMMYSLPRVIAKNPAS